MRKDKINFYIVATPIGNYGDITLRAIEILKNVDFIVCEQEKEYRKLFGMLGIKEKKYILCNEHNEKEAIELTIPLLKKGEKGALISDCGTPLYEDPGFKLVENIRRRKLTVTSVPGVSSLMTAISLSPFKIDRFYYAGFLPKKDADRRVKLKSLLKNKEIMVFIEAPYRLKNTILILKELASNRMIFIAYDLTMESEELIWGIPNEVDKELDKKNIKKGEFILIINKI